MRGGISLTACSTKLSHCPTKKRSQGRERRKETCRCPATRPLHSFIVASVPRNMHPLTKSRNGWVEISSAAGGRCVAAALKYIFFNPLPFGWSLFTVRSNNCNVQENSRFGAYCPFCQSTTKADQKGSGDAESFRPLPPSYISTPELDPPPSYQGPSSPPSSTPSGIWHYLRPDDSVLSLSLLYKVPAHAIRSYNRLFSDHMLHARRGIEIPSPPYNGPSLSHPPTEEELEQEAKKSKIKRFQLKTKCVDFDSAEVYLEEAGWNEELAANNWLADEKWVKENPMIERGMGGKGKEVVGKGGRWGLRGFGY